MRAFYMLLSGRRGSEISSLLSQLAEKRDEPLLKRKRARYEPTKGLTPMITKILRMVLNNVDSKVDDSSSYNENSYYIRIPYRFFTTSIVTFLSQNHIAKSIHRLKEDLFESLWFIKLNQEDINSGNIFCEFTKLDVLFSLQCRKAFQVTKNSCFTKVFSNNSMTNFQN